MTAAAELPAGLERDYPLARLTTIRTGGPAGLVRPPPERLRARGPAAVGRRVAGLDVGVVGSGSNLLVADAGFAGLVLKLDGALARIEDEGDRLVCGGGARLPQAAARAATLGLTGLEFGVSIPGTVGGAVRMNANAYGGELGRVLEWVDVCAPTGTYRRAPGELGFEYRRSNIGPREVVARASFALERARARDRQGGARRPAGAPQGGPALRHQDLRLDVQEPGRPARGGPHRGSAARGGGLQGPRGRAVRASRPSTRTSSRTAATPRRATCSS